MDKFDQLWYCCARAGILKPRLLNVAVLRFLKSLASAVERGQDVRPLSRRPPFPDSGALEELDVCFDIAILCAKKVFFNPATVIGSLLSGVGIEGLWNPLRRRLM